MEQTSSGPQGLNDASPHWRGQPSLLDLPIQMLIYVNTSHRHVQK